MASQKLIIKVETEQKIEIFQLIIDADKACAFLGFMVPHFIDVFRVQDSIRVTTDSPKV